MTLQSLRHQLGFATLALPLVLLAGCGITAEDPTAPVAVSGMSGAVMGGQQPVVGATVFLMAAGATGYGQGASIIRQADGVTDSHGNYHMGAFTCAHSYTPTYLLATGGDAGGGVNSHIVLATASGTCAQLSHATTINFNEVTTAATALAMSHFFANRNFGGSGIGGPEMNDYFGSPGPDTSLIGGLLYADAYTVPQLVNLQADSAHAALITSTYPDANNPGETIKIARESARLNSMANTLAACVNSNGSTAAGSTCGKLFSYTNTGYTPTDTLQAAVQMALYPWKNVTNLYNLASATSPFVGLSTAPNDWTLGISYQTSRYTQGYAPSNMEIDAQGTIWFCTFDRSTNSFALALFDPSGGLFTAPILPNYLQKPSYLAINRQGTVAVADSMGKELVLIAPPSSAPSLKFVVSNLDQPATVVAAPGANTSSEDIFYYTDGTQLYKYQDTNFPSQLQGAFQYVPLTITDSLHGGSLYINVATSYSSGQADGPGYCLIESAGPGPFQSGITFTRSSQYSMTRCRPGYIANAGTNQLLVPSTSDGTFLEGGTTATSPLPADNTMGVQVDGDGDVWVTNNDSGSSTNSASISTFAISGTQLVATSTVPYLHDVANGSTLRAPGPVAIDRSGNVWTLSSKNFGGDPSVLFELVGAAAPTLTPIAFANLGPLDGSGSDTGTRPSLTSQPLVTPFLEASGAKINHRP